MNQVRTGYVYIMSAQISFMKGMKWAFAHLQGKLNESSTKFTYYFTYHTSRLKRKLEN